MSNEHIADEFKDQDANPIGGGGGPDEFIMKSADEDVVNSTAVQNDDELFFSVKEGEMWYMIAEIFFDGVNALDYTFDTDSGAPDVAIYIDLRASDSPHDFGNVQSRFGSASNTRGLAIRAILDNTNGGDTIFRFKWAQRISNPVAATILKGSTLLGWKKT